MSLLCPAIQSLSLAKMSATSESSLSNQTNPSLIKIRYRFGMAPDRIIDTDPSIVETVRAMEKMDGAVFAGTTLIPAIYGYRIQGIIYKD